MELNRLGYCIGSDEVTRYKQSIVENENVTDFLCGNLSGSFTQWSADNADHNLCTSLLRQLGPMKFMQKMVCTRQSDKSEKQCDRLSRIRVYLFIHIHQKRCMGCQNFISKMCCNCSLLTFYRETKL